MILSKGLRATQVCLQACRANSSFHSLKSAPRILIRLPRNSGLSGKLCNNQLYTSGRNGVRGRARTEAAAPSATGGVGTTAIGVGQAAVAGASVLALGGLCYYGMGLAPEAGAVDRAAFWPAYVKERVKDTYMYFGGSLIATAGTAYGISQNATLMRLASSNGLAAMVITIGAMIGTSMIARNIEYKPGFGSKQMAWLLHTGVVGAVIAPLTMLGGPLLVRAAWYTAGIVGGLSTMAMCAPSDKFLNMGGPLACGLGLVFVSSIGSAFFPPTGAVGMSLYSIAVYGGLVLFSAFLLYDTQRIIKKAETHPAPSPYYNTKPFDPVNASMSIYMDTINIFIRIAMIMANNKRK